jgi:hypothetical protein
MLGSMASPRVRDGGSRVNPPAKELVRRVRMYHATGSEAPTAMSGPPFFLSLADRPGIGSGKWETSLRLVKAWTTGKSSLSRAAR